MSNCLIFKYATNDVTISVLCNKESVMLFTVDSIKI